MSRQLLNLPVERPSRTDASRISGVHPIPVGLRVHCAEGMSEEELLGCMLARDNRAWGEFLRRYRKLMRTCIEAVTRRFASILTSSDVDDIFCLLLCSLQARDMHRLRVFQVHRGVRLSTWIGLLARNAAWDYLRTQARRVAFRELSDARERPSELPDPEHTLCARQRWQQTLESLATLSERDQLFVQLYWVEGRTPEEVAQRMELSIKTVYTKKHKLRAKLDAVFEAEED